MSKMAVVAAAFLLSARVTWALVLQQPKPTSSTDDAFDGQGWTPRPTQAPIRPRYAAMNEGQLFGRQASEQTCAYISGHADAPFTCYSGAACYWFNAPSYLACCSTDSDVSSLSTLGNCGSASACIPYEENNVAFGDDAVTSSGIVYCPEALSLCGTVYISGTASTDGTWSFYSCGTVNTTIGMYWYTTDDGAGYSGPTVVTTDPAPLTITEVLNQTILVTSSGVPTSIVSVSGATVISSATGSPLHATTPTSTSVGHSSLTSGAPAATSSSETHPSHSGAIAGGVVGGVAAIALIAGTIAYLVRRKQNQRRAPMPEISQYGSTPKLA